MKRAFEKLPEEFILKAKVYDYGVPATEAISKISSSGAVIVQKGRKYYGMVDERSFLRKGELKIAKTTSIGSFAEKVPVLGPSMSIDGIISSFYNSAKKALPYGENGSVSKIVKRESMLGAILSLHLLKDFIVKDGATFPAIAIDYQTNITQAQKLMKEHRINRLVVVKERRTYGILAYRDLMTRALAVSERPPERMQKRVFSSANVSVDSMCEKNVRTIDQRASMEDAIRSMISNKISSLVVVKDGNPTGIITVRDIFELVAANAPTEDNYITVSGLDDGSKEYEQEIRDEISGMIKRINKFHKINTSYVSVNIKKTGERNYGVRVRLIASKGGALGVAGAGFSLDQALGDAISKMYNAAKERKERIVTRTREKEREENE
jgi:signal-transduction protein with cAMP-binding, CBS, and nucleotidyltransferase domain